MIKKFVRCAGCALLVLVMTLLPAAAGIMVPEGMNLYPRFPFNDVPYDQWYFESILYCYDNGLMNGKGERTFAPDKTMTRAEFVTMLGRLAEAELIEIDKFSDVVPGQWYSGYIGWAVEEGIVDGFQDGTFRPNNPINREQMAKVLATFIASTETGVPEAENVALGFADIDSVSEWAKGYLESLRKTGLIEGSNGKFYPKNNMTRAQAATILMRLDRGLVAGAMPDSMIFSALDLRCNSFYVNSAMTLDESGEYPVIKVNGTSVEFDLHTMVVDPDTYPVIRLIYKGADVTEMKYHNALDSDDMYWGNYTSPCDVSATPAVETIDSYKSVCYDLTEGYDGELMGEDDLTTSLTFTFADGGEKEILCLGFFRSEEDADVTVDGIKDELLSDPVDDVFFEEITDDVLEGYLADAEKRIDEIINTEGGIDPATIKGECYYISSINGDDSNDGLSPETAWATTDNLVSSYAGGQVWISNVKSGDGVFFERGSTFTHTGHLNFKGSGRFVLFLHSGVTYSVYGEGEKPLFTTALQTSTPAGTWEETEYKNVWRLVDELPNSTDPISDDIGNISFNDELWGVKVIPDSYNSRLYETPYGENVKTIDIGIVSNGEEAFKSGGVTFDNYGALCHNLEYFHDLGADELYLYYDKGNPGEVFDEIKIALNSCAIRNTFSGGQKYGDMTMPTVVDNFAIKNVGCMSIAPDMDNFTAQNCVTGWIGGSIQGETVRYGGGIGAWAVVDNWTVKNCYLYQSYDECVSVQGTSSMGLAPGGNLIKNVVMEDCVTMHATAAYTAFNWNSSDEAGLSGTNIGNKNLTDGLVIRNNYMLYHGYGFSHTRPKEYTDSKDGSFTMAGSFNDEHYINSVFENNVCLYANACSIDMRNTAAPALAVRHGMILRNNVYLLGSDKQLRMMEYMDEGTRVGSYARYRYGDSAGVIAHLNRLGIETGSKFYYYDGYFNELEAEGAYR